MLEDSIKLTDSGLVLHGISSMLTAAIGEHGYLDSKYVSLPIALFIVHIARRSHDCAEWFPHGKWATIQNIER